MYHKLQIQYYLYRKLAMELIGDFNTKVYETSDKKKLKDSSKTYTYGTVSIRDPKLNEYIGSDVIVRIFKKSENDLTS